jgi:hypothetical protein
VKTQDKHLNEDQMIRAIVDENDMTMAEHNHLLECSLCQKEKQSFAQVLRRIGETSKELVPSPRRMFIPVHQERFSLLRWRPALAVGVVILLLMIGIWGTSLFTRFHKGGSVYISKQMESDQQSVTEMMFAEEDALPDRYLYIIGNGNSDDDVYYDDEFLEFVLPL